MALNGQTYLQVDKNVKDAWAKGIDRLVPEENIIQRGIAKMDSEMDMGGFYFVPLITKYGQGATYHASGSSQQLNPAVSSPSLRLQINAPGMTMRDRITYEAIKRLERGGYTTNGIEDLLTNLKLSHVSNAESNLLYGQAIKGWGEISAVDVVANTTTITAGEWTVGLFADRIGALFDAYTSAGVYVKTIELKSYEPETRKLFWNDVTGLAATHILRPFGASIANNNEIRGIHSIVAEPGTSYFGNLIANEPLLKASTFDAGAAPLTFLKIMAIITRQSFYSNSGQHVALVNPYSYIDLVNEIESARHYGGNQYKVEEMDRGIKGLVIHTPRGSCTIYAHPKVKAGYAYGLMMDTWKRCGVTDIILESAISQGQSNYYLFQVPDANAFEIRTYHQYSIYTKKPAAQWCITNIVPTYN